MIGRHSPSVLGQICRKWREIAFGTPELWRGITLCLTNRKRLDQKLRLLQIWLQRSGSCPLSINMDLGDRIDHGVVDLFTQAIAAYSVRWEHLRLYSIFHPFPSIKAPLPSLRSLSMGTIKPLVEGAPSTESLISALHAAPLLRNVAIAFWGEHSIISLYPWSQLTAFTAHPILPHYCLDILAQAVNLVTCNVYICRADEIARTSIARDVALPQLSTLILRGYISDTMSWKFLDCLTLPALQKLEVAETLLQDDPVGLLESLIARSRCSLLELHLPHRRLAPESYRLALPTVGSVIDGELDVGSVFFVPDDEENFTWQCYHRSWANIDL
ncbi:hypothetical protein B0H16DRAFT_345893 [Mycena metata]|uniref:F-box domain-containing protein n=1 Tax=Mycena metata TaxID=1033252 RepID=A0AAD7HKH6_9AGAR|nr:hypothetical protein B0H16DRAFT_345893 [Mycena metata]